MAEISKKVTRKVIKKGVTKLSDQSSPAKNAQTTTDRSKGQREDAKVKKTCYFCESKVTPFYTDVNGLRKCLTERGKIVPKLRSGLCSKHQRMLTTQVKYARFLALIPFSAKI